MTDPVNHPAHYTEHPSDVECIHITEHMGFNLGNAVKYIWRADLKGSAIQDLEKARWYIACELVKRGLATEPAVERCQSVSIFRERCALVPGHDGRHAAYGCAWGYPPAPAEPTEEATKAEGPCMGGGDMHPCVLPAGHAGVHTDSRGLRWNNPATSPVVPAPTETDWQTWQEVPEGVKYSPKARPPAGSPLRLLAQPLWVNRGGTRYQARSGTVSKIGDVEMFHYSPFVAAEEG